MKVVSRLVSVGVGALALMLVLGGTVVPAEAASAKSVYVGTPGNGCPSKGTYYPDIQTAVDSMPQPKKITVCPGVYDSFEVAGKNNMKIIAKGLAVVLPAYIDFNGPIIHVQNSNKITIQGFVIDGNGDFESGATGSGGYGIWYDQSSGSILKNTVLRISETPLDNYNMAPFTGILISGSGGQPVNVASNTVKDYEWAGINVNGNVRAQITKNRIDGPSYLPTICPCGEFAPTGIVIENNASSKVTANTIQSNFIIPLNLSFGLNFTYGVVLYQSSGVLVSINKLSKLGEGVFILDDGSSGAGANRNKISNNTFTDAFLGVEMLSSDVNGIAQFNTHTDSNRVTGNKFVSEDFFVAPGILLGLDDDAADDPGIQAFSNANVISNNKMFNYGYFFGDPIDIALGVTNTIVSHNKTDLLTKPGAAPGPQTDMPSIPRPFLPSKY